MDQYGTTTISFSVLLLYNPTRGELVTGSILLHVFVFFPAPTISATYQQLQTDPNDRGAVILLQIGLLGGERVLNYLNARRVLRIDQKWVT